MRIFIQLSLVVGIVLGFSGTALCEGKCTGTALVNSLNKDAKAAPGFVGADITFDSGTFACKGMSFAKTDKPTTDHEAVLGFAPGVSKEIVTPGAKLKMEYESVYLDPESTMGMGPEWDVKWTVLGEEKVKS